MRSWHAVIERGIRLFLAIAPPRRELPHREEVEFYVRIDEIVAIIVPKVQPKTKDAPPSMDEEAKERLRMQQEHDTPNLA